jgi:hypothetical protein
MLLRFKCFATTKFDMKFFSANAKIGLLNSLFTSKSVHLIMIELEEWSILNSNKKNPDNFDTICEFIYNRYNVGF